MSNVLSLREWSDGMRGARAAVARMIEEYFRQPCRKGDKPYREAEFRFILASIDNTWEWLASEVGKEFHYRNHKKDKNGNVIYCEAYIPKEKMGAKVRRLEAEEQERRRQ